MKSLLVADAEPPIRHALRTVLECQECRVICTTSVEDTLTVLSYFKPNLILAEEGLGLAVLKRLESRGQTVPAPVLLITEDDKPKETSGPHYLKRPFEVKDLVGKVTEVLGGPCPAD